MVINFPYQGSDFDSCDEFVERHDADFLTRLLYSMLRIRRIEEAIEGKYHEDQMKTPIHLVIGQEAASVGACSALRESDILYCGHRTHGAYLAKGGDLKGMLSEFFCRLNGCAGSRGGSMHLLDKSVGMAGSSAIVAGAVPIATGAALSAQLRGDDYVSCVFLGDAATEEGAVWESLNFAALKKLPIIYFCENNFFSVCTPLEERQPAGVAIYKKAAAFGLHSVQVDGSNVLKVNEAVADAVARARRGEGPSFIEAEVYRWRGHGGAGDDSHTGYRDPAEVAYWQKHCPVEGYADFLQQQGVLNALQRAAMEQQISDEISEAFLHAEKSPNPRKEDLYTHAYCD
ncbi:MAG: thiamine pyrophosphate-dependent dehydrogenase E1 component subunit alpha [Gammaproteobacteria bacterium]|nr:thiamine pyrophosphate-dependent dehydrogenase E1 component subunit alpha [Gammaproteobacteria bacterium]MCF6230166.1 thiamine pyrophosphate-dependent dehydrogenase E1 component subunit alpha [Gammaproteobacteria bacterium]